MEPLPFNEVRSHSDTTCHRTSTEESTTFDLTSPYAQEALKQGVTTSNDTNLHQDTCIRKAHWELPHMGLVAPCREKFRSVTTRSLEFPKCSTTLTQPYRVLKIEQFFGQIAYQHISIACLIFYLHHTSHIPEYLF